MRIIYKYLLKEMGGPFLAALCVSTLILAAGNIVQTADMVINKGVSLIVVVKMFMYFLPYVLIFTIPISVLSAVLLGFGRLSGDNEVTAMRTSGISLYRVSLPIIVSGLLVSLFNVPLNDKILPQSEYNARKLFKQVGVENPVAMLEAGVFIKGFKDYVVFIHGIEGHTLKNIRIYQPQEDKPTRAVVARAGEIISMPETGSVKLKLIDGTADEIKPDNPDEFYKLTFQEYYMTLNADKSSTDKIGKKAREKSIRELLADMRMLGNDKKDAIPLRIELHKKIALAFSNLVFVLVGIPLAITTHRREKVIGFALAMGLFLLYWAIMLGGIAFAIRGILPAWLGVWSANILLLGMSVRMFRGLVSK